MWMKHLPLQEAPRALALRLALAKARAVAAVHPEAVVIGSDQVADLNGVPLGKAGARTTRAVLQLQRMRGQNRGVSNRCGGGVRKPHNLKKWIWQQ